MADLVHCKFVVLTQDSMSLRKFVTDRYSCYPPQKVVSALIIHKRNQLRHYNAILNMYNKWQMIGFAAYCRYCSHLYHFNCCCESFGLRTTPISKVIIPLSPLQ